MTAKLDKFVVFLEFAKSPELFSNVVTGYNALNADDVHVDDVHVRIINQKHLGLEPVSAMFYLDPESGLSLQCSNLVMPTNVELGTTSIGHVLRESELMNEYITADMFGITEYTNQYKTPKCKTDEMRRKTRRCPVITNDVKVSGEQCFKFKKESGHTPCNGLTF